MYENSRNPLASLFPFFGSTGSNLMDLVVKSILNAFVIALSLTLFLLFLLGSYDSFNNNQHNKCQMTWMFQYPQYIPIKLDNWMDGKYPMYGLYAYAEGQDQRPKFNGIPVLFIPGNAGSHKQVRSLASVALRKWLDSRSPYHFDFFSVDFNEELSALYGYVLNPQAEYVKAAIDKIQSLYEYHHSVVLVGHSMGGVVAKAMVDEEPMSNLILTLASPHARPVVILDPEQDLFYFHLSRNWTGSGKTKEVTLVSIAGGDRDHHVEEGITQWRKHMSIHTTTTAIPAVWTSTDHRCIVWCKQLVLSIVRALFDLVELKKPNGYYAINEDYAARQNILEYHLVKRSSGKSYHTAHPMSELSKPPHAHWNELIVTKFCLNSTRARTYLMFPKQVIKERVIRGNPEDYALTLITTNTAAKNWIYGCTSQSFMEDVRYCSTADNLSPLGQILPHIRRRRKVIHLKYTDISKYSHLIVLMDSSQMKSCVDLDIYDEADRSQKLVGKFDSENKLFYNLSLPNDGILTKFVAWRISASLLNNETCEKNHNSLALFKHGNFGINRFLKNESLVARYSDWNASVGTVQLYLEPTCKYNIKINLANLETAGQIFRTFRRLLPSFFASIFLMSLYFQKSATDWLNFHRILISNAYFLTLFPGFLTSILLAILPNDWPVMIDGLEYSIFIPFFCYLVAYILVLLTASGGWYVIIGFGNVAHTILIKFIGSRVGRWAKFCLPMPPQVTEIALDFTFGKFPVIISVVLFSITMATCGALGLVVGLALYIVKLFKMYEDILEDLWRGKIQNVADSLSPLNFQFSCAMLWFVVTVLNIPSLVHWAKNISTGTVAQWDLSMYLCLMLIPTIAVLWQNYVPNFNESLWKAHRCVFYGMGMCLVVWGTFRLYILGFIVTFVLITTAICQLISSLGFALAKADEAAAAATTTQIPITKPAEPTVPLPEESEESNVEDSEGEELRAIYKKVHEGKAEDLKAAMEEPEEDLYTLE